MLSLHDILNRQYCNAECGKTFSVLSKLKQHAESHLARDDWKYSCDACDTTFPSSSRLKVHIHEWMPSKLFYSYSDTLLGDYEKCPYK